MKNYLPLFFSLLVMYTLSTSCNSKAEPIETNTPDIHPKIWPKTESSTPIDAAIESKIDDLIASMTIEELVGQTIQADIASIKPEDLLTHRLGSILNGGNSAPNNDPRSPAEDWLKLADEFYEASMNTSKGGKAIPILWGTDAVHGHNNIIGATIFPHNIGLGAANNPDLIRQIGAVTAREVIVTGMDWTFAPTLAVVRNDRWGPFL